MSLGRRMQWCFMTSMSLLLVGVAWMVVTSALFTSPLKTIPLHGEWGNLKVHGAATWYWWNLGVIPVIPAFLLFILYGHYSQVLQIRRSHRLCDVCGGDSGLHGEWTKGLPGLKCGACGNAIPDPFHES